MRRQLVVNADDLGLTGGVNDGIFAAHERGILTSASIFANGPASADAIERSQADPSLGIGAHLTLVDGTPALPPWQVPTLVTDDGRFHSSWKPFIVACLRGQISLDEVERELTTQINRLRLAGLELTHLDTHKHVHLYPPIFRIVARLAVRFGIRVVRAPFERWSALSLAAGNNNTRRMARGQALLNTLSWPWAWQNYRVARSLGLRTPQFIGRIHTGVMSSATLRRLLHATKPGVTELMLHPGHVDDALWHVNTRLLDSRQQELNLLCGLEAGALLVAEQIELVRHDLTHPARRSLRQVS
jgi:predicted glycoside hydrolase/deacetylase ChbG (UPF0249 family)